MYQSSVKRTRPRWHVRLLNAAERVYRGPLPGQETRARCAVAIVARTSNPLSNARLTALVTQLAAAPAVGPERAAPFSRLPYHECNVHARSPATAFITRLPVPHTKS